MALATPPEQFSASDQKRIQDAGWTTILDSSTDTIATSKTAAAATSSHYDISRLTDIQFSVAYTKNTTTAAHVVPQFSMDGTMWYSDVDDRDPTAIAELSLDYTASTGHANALGVVHQAIRTRFRFFRVLAWWDGTVGTDSLSVKVSGGAS